MNLEEESRVCRICFEEETKEKSVINPCKCKGSSKFIHEECLSTWILTQDMTNNDKRCEVCKYLYNIKVTSVKKCDPRQSFSQNPHFVCYLCILFMVTALLVILIYVIVQKGYVDPQENIFYFLGLMGIFGFALICSLSIMFKLIKGILFVETQKALKIFPVKSENVDLNTTIIVNSLQRVDSADIHENPGDEEEIRRMNN